MPFALEAERFVSIVKGHMIRSAINRRQFTGVSRDETPVFVSRGCHTPLSIFSV
jgi:hypothetical protein